MKKIRLLVSWDANNNIENVRIRFVIFRADGNVVGMACSKSVLNGVKECKYKSLFEYDISNLVEGAYSFHIIAFETNDYGTIADYDKPNCRMYFEIYNDVEPKIQWSTHFVLKC